MKSSWKIATALLLAAAVAATFALRAGNRAAYVPVPAPGRSAAETAGQPGATRAAAKPRLLELGSNRCQACQQMAVVLDALRAGQGAKLQVDFIDVFEQPEAAERYQVAMIPTQVLFDGEGREIFRHVGFFSHDDILAKFRELGVKL